MNKVILCGRLTADPKITYAGGTNACIGKFGIAADRKFKRDNEPTADFINITAFSKLGEFTEKYLHKGTKIIVVGRIQTGSYTDANGKKVYTTDVIAEEIEFAESKNSNQSNDNSTDLPIANNDGFKPVQSNDLPPFMNIPNGAEDLPFAPPTR